MTNDIEVGDVVTILPRTECPYPVMGKVIEIDDHPLEYAMLRLELDEKLSCVAYLPMTLWISCRNVKKGSL
jgi:hypothetical protein